VAESALQRPRGHTSSACRLESRSRAQPPQVGAVERGGVDATDELRLGFGAGAELAPWTLGAHIFGPEAMNMSLRWRFGSNTS